MSSCSHHHHSNESKNLGIVFLLNFGFAILEFIGGILSNSTALIADAIHDMGDALAIALAWVFSKIGQKKRSKNFSYGYKRFSLLSALIASLILVFGAIAMLVLALQRIQNPLEVQSDLMILFALFGVVVNGLAVLKIKAGKTMNEKVISLHLLEDLLGWVAVLVGAIVIYFTGWHLLDPIMAIGISLWIFIHGLRKGGEVAQLFLQSMPENVDQEALIKSLEKISGVKEVHDLHAWSLDGDKNVGSCHIVIKPKANPQSVKKQVRDCFTAQHIQHVTIEVEGVSENCPHQDC